jgi:O-antigen/teichoic acid export membrane protein
VSFFRQAASVLATSVATVPLSILANVVVTRNLDTTERGQFAVVTVLAGTLVLFSNLGWPLATIYRLKRLKSDPAEVMTASVTAMMVLAATVLVLGWGLQMAGLGDFGAVPAEILWLGLATVPFQLLVRLFTYAAKGIDRFDIRNWATFAAVGLRTAGLSLAWYLFPGDLAACLWINLAAAAGVALASGVAVLRQTGLSRRVNRREIRESLGFGLETTAQTLAGELHQQVDILLMGPLNVAPAQIALYSIAAGLIQQLRIVPDAIGLALFPKLTGSEDAAAVAFTYKVCRHSMLWVVLFSLGLGAIVPFLVPLLYGEAYSAALPAFYILLPAMGLLTVYRVVARYFISRGRQRLNIVTQLIALVVNVGLNFVLMPRYGIEGAAVSSLISYGLEAVIIAVVFLRETGGGARALLLFRLDWFRGEDWAVYQRRIDGLRARFRGRTRPPPN